MLGVRAGGGGLQHCLVSSLSQVIIRDDTKLDSYLKGIGFSSDAASDVHIYEDESWKCKLIMEHYVALRDGQLDLVEMIDCLQSDGDHIDWLDDDLSPEEVIGPRSTTWRLNDMEISEFCNEHGANECELNDLLRELYVESRSPDVFIEAGKPCILIDSSTAD